MVKCEVDQMVGYVFALQINRSGEPDYFEGTFKRFTIIRRPNRDEVSELYEAGLA